MSFFKNPFKKELSEEQVVNSALGNKVIDLLSENPRFSNMRFITDKNSSYVDLGIVDWGTTNAYVHLKEGRLDSITFCHGSTKEEYCNFKKEYTETPEKIVELIYNVFVNFRDKFNDINKVESIKRTVKLVPIELNYIRDNYSEGKVIPITEFLDARNKTSNITIGSGGNVSTNPLD